jgi:outer membrane protein assembly factor BamE (lipoprotein component of BamABCDE complex)
MNTNGTLKGIFTIALTAAVLTGCSTTGRRVDQTQIDTIQIGDHKTEVQTAIGAPDQVSRSATGIETWTYAYSRSRPNAKRFIPLLGTFIGGKNVESQTITVLFDDTGRVADIATAYGGKDAQGRPITTTTGAATSTTTTTTTTTP